MPRINDEEYDSGMNMSYESSSESNLRANAAAKGSALAKESYSEQRLRKNAKPMVKAKAKPKAMPVVGRAGAQTPGQRAKLALAKSADAARAGAMRPKSSSTGGYPRPTAKTTSTGAKSSVKRPAVMSNAGKAGSVRGASSPTKKTVTKPATNSRFSAVAATNAKRMGISVAEYNRRLNAKRGK